MSNLKRDIEAKRGIEAFVETLGVDGLKFEKTYKRGTTYTISHKVPDTSVKYDKETGKFFVKEIFLTRDIDYDPLDPDKIMLRPNGTSRDRASHVKPTSPKVAYYFKETMGLAVAKGIIKARETLLKNKLLLALRDVIPEKELVEGVSMTWLHPRTNENKTLIYVYTARKENTESVFTFTVTETNLEVSKKETTIKEYDYKNRLDLVIGELAV